MNQKTLKLADHVVTQSFRMKAGERFVITSDYLESDLELADAVYKKAREIGAEGYILRGAPAESHGKLADKVIPFEMFTAMLKYADCWLDLGSMGYIYSDAYEAVMRAKADMRYFLLSSIPVDHLYNLVVLPEEVVKLAEALYDMLYTADTVRITNEKGTDATYRLTRAYALQCKHAQAYNPGLWTPGVSVNMFPMDDTLTGRIVVNCIYGDPWGKCDDIALILDKGTIVEIEAKNPDEGRRLKAWLARLEDPNIYRTAHMNFGLLPGIQDFIDTGRKSDGITNERIWGCMNWGFGEVSAKQKPPKGQPCKDHIDGISPKVSAWIDGVQIMERGTFIYGKLKEYADAALEKVQQDVK